MGQAGHKARGRARGRSAEQIGAKGGSDRAPRQKVVSPPAFRGDLVFCTTKQDFRMVYAREESFEINNVGVCHEGGAGRAGVGPHSNGRLSATAPPDDRGALRRGGGSEAPPGRPRKRRLVCLGIQVLARPPPYLKGGGSSVPAAIKTRWGMCTGWRGPEGSAGEGTRGMRPRVVQSGLFPDTGLWARGNRGVERTT